MQIRPPFAAVLREQTELLEWRDHQRLVDRAAARNGRVSAERQARRVVGRALVAVGEAVRGLRRPAGRDLPATSTDGRVAVG